MKHLLCSLVLFFCTLSANALVITHGSAGGAFTQGNGSAAATAANFDRGEFTFSSVFADTISLGNMGLGLAHDHGNGARSILEVFNGSSWVNVFTSANLTGPHAGGSLLSNIFASPITFAGMTISGLRLNASQPVRQMYHRIDGAMTYTLSTTQAVSEPATFVMFGLGLAGIVVMRRRKTNTL